MFAKSQASSRVVMRWLVCLMVALALSGCCSTGVKTKDDICLTNEQICKALVTGGCAILLVPPPICAGLCLGCGLMVVSNTTRGADDIHKKAASGVVIIIADDGKAMNTGAVLSPEGYILTSKNFIADAKSVQVFFLADMQKEDKQRISYVAEKVKIDQQYGLALLKLSNPPQNLTVLDLVSDSQMQKNQTIYTVGHSSVDRAGWVYSQGVVSDIVSNFKWENLITSASYKTDFAVQTQTPINPGDVGAFLFDDQGKLAGMFVSSDAKDDRINYAIPAKVFADFVGQ